MTIRALNWSLRLLVAWSGAILCTLWPCYFWTQVSLFIEQFDRISSALYFPSTLTFYGSKHIKACDKASQKSSFNKIFLNTLHPPSTGLEREKLPQDHRVWRVGRRGGEDTTIQWIQSYLWGGTRIKLCNGAQVRPKPQSVVLQVRPQTCSVSSTWELVRHVNPWACLRPPESETWEWSPGIWLLTNCPGDLDTGFSRITEEVSVVGS